MSSDRDPTAPADFESLVNLHYPTLYRFALSLTHLEDEASDLTQQTFHIWAAKGGQLRDAAKAKTWLFTTLHREFLQARRRRQRFKHYELAVVEEELPSISAETARELDCAAVLEGLAGLEETFRAPLALFYLEDCSYNEIAEILETPLGTVKSRIARGLRQLQQRLLQAPRGAASGRRPHE